MSQIILVVLIFVVCYIIVAIALGKRDSSDHRYYEDYKSDKEQTKRDTQEIRKRNRNYDRMCNPDLKDKGWFAEDGNFYRSIDVDSNYNDLQN